MKATEPLWKSEDVPQYLPLLSTSRAVDVAVVGAGITGLTAAILLRRAGKDVAVIEARRIASGVTGSTSAHLTEVIDSRIHVIEYKFGKEGARLAAQSSRDAIEQIASWVFSLKIDCGFRRVPGYLFSEREEHKAELQKELEACVRAGMQVTATELPLPFQAAGALRFEHQAQFHPVQYLRRLAQVFVEEGGVIFEESPIVELLEGAPCVLKTAAGRTLNALQVILATHSPLNRVLVQTKLAHYQSYVVSGPAPAIADGLYWDMEDPYHYIRSIEVGGARHLIVGGEDHKTGQDSDAAAAFDRLTKWSAGRFGLQVEKRWSSQVVEPVDALPFIGRNAASTRVFIATGYSGNGLTFGTLAGMMLSDACLGKVNPYAELYAATRMKPFASLKSYLAENIDFPLHLIGDALKPAEASSVDELAPGEGKLVRIGASKAVYKSPEGELRAVSSVCPHLGCHVAFNNAEKTWDCPCHGSRFGTDGSVIAGPALKPLAPHEGPLGGSEVE